MLPSCFVKAITATAEAFFGTACGTRAERKSMFLVFYGEITVWSPGVTLFATEAVPVCVVPLLTAPTGTVEWRELMQAET